MVSLSAKEESAAIERPLKIIVTEAGRLAALKSLIGQCVPILRNPEAYSRASRTELAEHLARAIVPDADEGEDHSESSDSYEPGMWLEEHAL